MPVFLRNFYMRKLQSEIEKEEKLIERANSKNKMGSPKKTGPRK
jgi:hypothetical protein